MRSLTLLVGCRSNLLIDRSFDCLIDWLYGWYGVVVADSSQMLFSISQKLIQHQILNYTEILKWLREILICHIQFLQKHRDYANVGSNIPICRQAHIKLEVLTSAAWLCCSVRAWWLGCWINSQLVYYQVLITLDEGWLSVDMYVISVYNCLPRSAQLFVSLR